MHEKKHLHNVATSLRIGIDTVNSCKDQFFLQMAQLGHVLSRLLDLDLWISSDDTKAGAGSIKQHSVELVEHLGALATILAHDNSIGYA